MLKGDSSMTTQQQGRNSILWRIIYFIIAIILAFIAVMIWFLSSGNIAPEIWSYIITGLFMFFGLIFTLGAWLFPMSPINVVRSLRPIVSSTSATAINVHDHNDKTEPAMAQTSTQNTVAGKIDPSDVFQFNVQLIRRNDFYGRDLAIETLNNRAHKANPTSIVGPRRIGKTWLITYLRLMAETNSFGSHYIIGYLDASTPLCSTIAGFTARALEEIGNPLILVDKNSPTLSDLEKTVRSIKYAGRTPILCIDEFEGLTSKPVFDRDFFTHLRAIAQEGLGLVTASRVPLTDLVAGQTKTSPFFNIFERIKLEPFTRKEAEIFVQSKGKRAGLTSEQQEFLLECGQLEPQQWWPARLQLAGKMMLEDINAQKCEPSADLYRQVYLKRLDEEYKSVVGI